jgi:GTPase SAR1 family protein
MRRSLLTAFVSFWGFLLAAVIVEPAKHFIDDQIKRARLLDTAWALMKAHPGWLGLGFITLGLLTAWAWLSEEADRPRPALTAAESARREMLNLVRNRWITGLLKQILNQNVPLEPGLIGVANESQPSDSTPSLITGGAQPFPPESSVVDIFDEYNGRLLILGAPGAGKTTLLLKLTNALLERARQSSEAHIPVVFSLSSWAGNHLSLADWMVEQLVGPLYRIPTELAKDWIHRNSIIPLLDGLDTVPAQHRATCIKAINHFGRVFPPIAVSCRENAYYQKIGQTLDLNALKVQPLRREEVISYLVRLGPSANGVRQALLDDPHLWNILQLDNPLMLDVVTRAYENKSATDLRWAGNFEERREIFKTYVARMFEHRRRSHSERYTATEVTDWLAWLAHQLFQRNIIDFHIERIQPDWLPETKVVGLSIGLVFQQVEGLIVGALEGLLMGPALLVIGYWFFDSSITGLVMASIVSLGGGLLCGFLGGLGLRHFPLRSRGATIEPVETVNWSLSAAKNHDLVLAGLGVVLSLMIGRFARPFSYQALVWCPDLGCAIGIWLLVCALPLIYWFIVVIRIIRSAMTIGEIQERVVPNQGILNSARNVVRYGSFGLLLIFISALISWRYYLFAFFAMLLGPLILEVVFYVGGAAVIQHYTVRALLAQCGVAPLKYAAFLDYAAELLLVYKIGGGYRFRHELLQEYFASLATTSLVVGQNPRGSKSRRFTTPQDGTV